MRCLIVGLGSIGTRHLRNIRALDPGGHVTVWHSRARPGERAEPDPAPDRVVYSLEEALDPRPDIAIIASPAPFHLSAALALGRRGVDLFIEKPLAADLTGVDEFLQVREEKKIIVMVGYTLRFHPALQAVKACIESGRIGRPLLLRADVGQYLPDWRPGTDYRESVSARSDLGGGAVRELSHELDYARWLLGEVRSVTARAGRVSDLAIDAEDSAEIILQFSEGAVGNIHLDMVQRPATRSCRVTGTDGTVAWDAGENTVKVYANAEGCWSVLYHEENPDRNAMYLAELAHFLSCVREQKEPCITALDGKRALQIVLSAMESSREERSVNL